MSVWRLGWRLAQHHRASFWSATVMFTLFFTLPVVSGWSLGRAFDSVVAGATDQTWKWVFTFLAVELGRMVAIHLGDLSFTAAWIHMLSLMRSNMLAAQVASGGREAGTPIASAGNAITHFRDDTEDAVWFVDGWIDIFAGSCFTVVAVAVMGAINLPATLVLAVPLASVAVVTMSLERRVKRYRAEDRAAAADVTGFVGDAMASATTIKVNNAVAPIIRRLRVLVDRRRVTATRDRVLEQSVLAYSRGATDVGLALVLLVAAPAIAARRFSVGDLTLFIAMLGYLAFFPRMIGRTIARRQQAEVAFERMARLVRDKSTPRVVAERDLPVGWFQTPSRPATTRPRRSPLERLDVTDLTVRFADGTEVGPVSLVVERGQMIVITGPIGTGKSTLLRAMLGLVPADATATGDVRWNRKPIADRAAFFVPPQAAYLPQVPQLLSDSIADNIAFEPLQREQIAAAVDLAVMSTDVAAMPDGLDTVIGPRGLRLSGGQRQRLAAARTIVHRPELVVLDDLSSALDVETELALWQHFAAAGMTVIAVSHRDVAASRADLVVTFGC